MFSIKDGGSTSTENQLRHHKSRSVAAYPAIETNPCSRKPIASTIHRLSILENKLRSANANAAVPQHWLDKTFEPRLLWPGIVVYERYISSPSDLYPCRITSREPFVLPQRNNFYLGEISPC